MTDAAHLTPFGEGIWLTAGPVQFLGMRLTSVMTVLRLGDGTLLLHSPVALSSELRDEVAALGSVSQLYAPNLFHHLRIGEWAAAFPTAKVHGPAGLAKKRPDLRIDRVFGRDGKEPAFEGSVEELVIDGLRLNESNLFHAPSRTLIVADLVHNAGRPEHAWTKLYTQMMGFYDRVALSRMLRWTAFSDRAAARASVDRVLALPFDRVVVGHGKPLLEGGKDAIAAAYAWLPSRA
jgi:hypothetical protein